MGSPVLSVTLSKIPSPLNARIPLGPDPERVVLEHLATRSFEDYPPIPTPAPISSNLGWS